MSAKLFKRILIISLIAGVFILIRYALRDIKLDINLLRAGLEKMPAIVIENISLEREVHGDIWSVKIPYLDRDGERFNLRSLDITRRIKTGGSWYFFGDNGFFSNDIRVAHVNKIRGTLEVLDNQGGRIWNLESPSLNWIESEDAIDFPQGLTVYDQEFLLDTPEANINKSGVVLLKRGGVITWTKPLK
ncbi:MAG: hypothetical protein IJG62_03255 [Synergistaceae bacterium]|nr:hypothetical protein [Synergistaceae bacterium]MBQ3627165.1 hypothetical protein [Synergistaceae bacterium]MBQ4419044.1 hypothetical protein [Synergistaceae bacterium]